jgi:hypothetical protein
MKDLIFKIENSRIKFKSNENLVIKYDFSLYLKRVKEVMVLMGPF